MPRGYRYVILASFGLILIGASPAPSGNTQAEQAARQRSVSKQSADVVAATPKANIAPSPDPGCENGKDDRKSDLCAQWKAADAAFDAARYGWWQIAIGWIGLVLSGVTMGAAIAAAVFAKKAAEAARGTLEADRAWICPAGSDSGDYNGFLNLTADGSGPNIPVQNGYIVQINWQNKGRSPALNVGCLRKYELVDARNKIVPVFDAEDDLTEFISVLAPDGIVKTSPIGLDDIDSTAFRSGEKALIIYSKVVYRDVFGSKQERVSELTWKLTYNGQIKAPNGQSTPNIMIIPVSARNTVT